MVYKLTQYFRGFTVVWAHQDQFELVFVYTWYVIRIAAVSQKHLPVCITRKITRAENDMVLVLPSKLTWLFFGWSKNN